MSRRLSRGGKQITVHVGPLDRRHLRLLRRAPPGHRARQSVRGVEQWLSTFIIVFRETLEAALIVAIVLAASKGIAGRALVGFGRRRCRTAAAPACWRCSPDRLADLFEGIGTEVFNAAVLLLAVAMLGWHHIWMGAHGAELAGESKRRRPGRARRRCSRSRRWPIICAVAVLREGSETVLFLFGIAVDGELDMPCHAGRRRARRRARQAWSARCSTAGCCACR